MRLTLRTLLAWMDDTLPPSEVREIGKQVAESAFAKELVERIHRVSRQRRLTVPSSSGPDATDANVVASYLDNELDPERVAELEKRCLTSDVHLAEVASVHQILSLIGQKAKVPSEARHRMYHLVKGRESAPSPGRPAAPVSAAVPVSEPVQPWVTPEPPRRPWLERFGPAAAVLALIVVLCWSAWKSLTPPEAKGRPGNLAALNAPNGAPGAALPATAPADGIRAPAAPEKPRTAKAAAAEASSTKPAEPEDPSKLAEASSTKPAAPRIGLDGDMKERAGDGKEGAEAKADAATPAGAVGQVVKTDGVLLRYNPQTREWDRIGEKTALRSQDRLLGLAPFRSRLALGTARADLVGETEAWVLEPTSKAAARLNLAQGRIVLHGTTPEAPFLIQFAGRDLKVTPPPGALVGLEKLYRRERGVLPTGSSAILKVFTADEGATVSADGADETLSGPSSIVFDAGTGKWAEKKAKDTPDWVTAAAASSLEAEIGAQFLKYFRADRPVITELVEAREDEQIDVRRLAISSLRAVNDISWIADLLYRPENPAPTRRFVIGVLRSYLAQGPEAAKALHETFQKELGEEQAGLIEKLLVGYTDKEARDEATFSRLVQLLSSENVGIRQLALDNLMSLTGRDDLGYDPEKPEGKGLRAWRDLLREHELRFRPAVGSER